MALTPKIGTGILSTSAAAWSRQVCTLVLYMVAARVLDPADIGLFTIAATILLLFEYGIYDSVSEAVVQREGLTDDHLGAALAIAALFAVLIAALPNLIPDLTGTIAGAQRLQPIMPVMAAAVASLCLSAVHSGLLRRRARFHRLALLSSVSALAACSIGITLMLTGAGLTSLVAYFVTEKVLLAVGTFLSVPSIIRLRFRWTHLLDIGIYSAAICGQRMAFFSRTQLDRLVIGVLWGPTVLGAYQVAARVFDSVQAMLVAPTSKLFFVSYVRLQRQPERLRYFFIDSLQVVSLVGFPAFLGLAAVSPTVILVLFGDKWEISASILQILSLGGVPFIFCILSGALLSAVGRAGIFLLIETLAAILGILLLILIAPFGILWIATVFLLREVLVATVYMIVLRRVTDLSFLDSLGGTAPLLFSSLLMALLVILLENNIPAELWAPLNLLLLIPCGALLYGCIALMLAREELSHSIGLLRQSTPSEVQGNQHSATLSPSSDQHVGRRNRQ